VVVTKGGGKGDSTYPPNLSAPPVLALQFNSRANIRLHRTFSQTTTFKNKLDKFRSNQDLIYDYKAEFTGNGSRSFISNLD